MEEGKFDFQRFTLKELREIRASWLKLIESYKSDIEGGELDKERLALAKKYLDIHEPLLPDLELVILERSAKEGVASGLESSRAYDLLRQGADSMVVNPLEPLNEEVDIWLAKVSQLPKGLAIQLLGWFINKKEVKGDARIALKEHLSQLRQRPVIPEVSEPAMPEPYQLNDEERQEAIGALKSNPIGYINKYTSLLYAGEERLCLLGVLTSLSSLFKRPLALRLRGSSSTGKSYLLEEIIQRCTPPERLIDATHITPKALYHLGEELSLDHVVFTIAERVGGEEAAYAIRELQSRGKLVQIISEQDPVTKKWITRRNVLEASVAFVETTTQVEIDMPSKTRCFEAFMDESPEQQLRVFEMRQRDELIGVDDEEVLRREAGQKLQNLQRVLPEDVVVTVPFGKHLNFDPSRPGARRYYGQLFCLIRCFAFLRYYQKGYDGSQKKFPADVIDYELAYPMALDLFAIKFERVSGPTKKILEAIKEHVQPGEEFKQRDIAGWVGRSDTYVRKWIKDLEGDYLNLIQGGKRGQTVIWQLLESTEEPAWMGLTTPEELKKKVYSVENEDF